MRESQALQEAAQKTAVSWTGGKDCNLALLKAWRDPTLNVVALVVFRPKLAKFRAHPIEIMNIQAQSLQLPLLQVEVSNEPDYKTSYINGMRELKEQHGINVIATGDMDLVGSMQRNWIQECGEHCGISAFLPLWQCDRRALLETMLAEDFVIVFSCVKSPHFDESWIGRQIDEKVLEEMEVKTAQGLDLGGEKGEYHTMVVGGPLYSDLLALPPSTALELTGEKGQKEGEKWWVMQAV